MYNVGMATNKTIPNERDVNDFLSSLSDRQQAEDSKVLIALMQDITKENPVMWGDSIIGFGMVHLQYASGRVLDWMKIGFSPRVGKISLYVTFNAATLTGSFPSLGKYKIAKGCIYIRRLSDVNYDELRKLIEYGFNEGFQQPKRADGKERIVDIK